MRSGSISADIGIEMALLPDDRAELRELQKVWVSMLKSDVAMIVLFALAGASVVRILEMMVM